MTRLIILHSTCPDSHSPRELPTFQLKALWSRSAGLLEKHRLPLGRYSPPGQMPSDLASSVPPLPLDPRAGAGSSAPPACHSPPPPPRSWPHLPFARNNNGYEKWVPRRYGKVFFSFQCLGYETSLVPELTENILLCG